MIEADGDRSCQNIQNFRYIDINEISVKGIHVEPALKTFLVLLLVS